MNPEFLLILLLIILIYSLYYSYNNDFGIFLYLILLITLCFYVYNYIEYKINLIVAKLENNMLDIKTQINDSLLNMNFIKNKLMSIFNQK